MGCLNTAIDNFMYYHNIDNIYRDRIIYYLKNSNYTVHTRLNPLFIENHITVQFIQNIEDIQPNTIIGIYIKPHDYLNVFGYHYFYVSNDSIISSWHTTRCVSQDEYNQLEYRPRSLSETSIENGHVDLTIFDLSVLNELHHLLNNDTNDIGYDLYHLFGGNDNKYMSLKKSEYKILMYMYNYT